MKNQDTFIFEKRQPIVGYPELRWTGKRPYNGTVYYPAQIKERYGEDNDGWINKLFWGDNLQVMSHLLKEFRGEIDLIYIDPPFDSKADYKKKIKLKGQEVLSDSSTFEEKQYSDIWVNDEYLQFMYERLILMRELLSDTGSIYVHLDEKKVHYIRAILDEVFGGDLFRREIIWDITVLSGFKVQANNWIRGHDIILYYSKSNKPIFNKVRQAHQQKYIDMFHRTDGDGEKFLVAHGKKRYLSDVLAKGKPFGDVWDDITSYQRLRKELDDVRTLGELKVLLSETRSIQDLSNVWDNIMSFQQQPTSSENVSYPTQKPTTLLERIILASSNPGDIVFDCFMGSGTTQAVAMKLGRKFIGADINLGAIQTTTKRLIKVASEVGNQEDKYTGFEVFNVNNYDFFRNPVQARELLIEALSIQPSTNSVFDGELDGCMVKIMPVNRIATKADADDLIAKLPYHKYERIAAQSQAETVENIILVCMGHEPDLKAHVVNSLKKYKVKVEVLDILRDKSDLQLKRDAEANIVIDGDKLVIKEFYPMNLLQKISKQKEEVDEWRQLVDSVMIDWNFDGVVMQPAVNDIPEKDHMVAGLYDIPSTAGRIKIKITDVLSESFEAEVGHE